MTARQYEELKELIYALGIECVLERACEICTNRAFNAQGAQHIGAAEYWFEIAEILNQATARTSYVNSRAVFVRVK